MHIKRIFTASSRDQISLCKIHLIPLFNGHAVIIMNKKTKSMHSKFTGLI